MKKHSAMLVVLLGLSVPGSPVFAQPLLVAPQVTFSTIEESGGSYYPGGRAIGGSSLQGPADYFVPNIAGTVSSIDLGLRYVESPQQVRVELRIEDERGWPGEILASGLVTANTSDTISLTSFVPSAPIQLSTDTGYWVAVLPLSTDTFVGWGQSLYADGKLATTRDGGATWGIGPPPQRMDAFQVTVIPEPTTFTLLSLGSLALVTGRREVEY